MNLFQIILLALVQGAAELLPVSSSAHVVVAEKLLGIDPTTPQATLLLVLLHTGTMLAVLAYFWKAWRASFFASREAAWRYGRLLALATLLTGLVGLGLKAVIERGFLRPGQDIETLFGNLPLVAAALAVGGVLILVAGLRSRGEGGDPDGRDAAWIGLVQGLCLPFRGFSRSGATISTALLRKVSRPRAEEFSFALAVILTPPVLYREFHRLPAGSAHASLATGLAGLVFSFVAGLLALRWLSRWLESGRWHRFGAYCLVASAAVFILHLRGF